jgi:hypothetical protein
MGVSEALDLYIPPPGEEGLVGRRLVVMLLRY